MISGDKTTHVHSVNNGVREFFESNATSIFIAFLIILIVPECKKVGPTEIDDHDKSLSYYLYVGNWKDEIFIVDTDSNVVVDTIRGFVRNICEVVVTHSGKKMYVTTEDDSKSAVYVVDLRSRNVLQILDKVADVYLAPNGSVFIITSNRYYGVSQIGAIDTLYDGVNFFDTLNIRDRIGGHDYQNVVFDVNRNLLYGINRDNKLFAYDYV